MSLLALAAGILLCGISVWRGFHGAGFMGRPLGGDFVLFYVAGKIANTYSPWRIYDLDLAVALQHATLPTMARTQMLVFGHAPYLVWIFRPFALLPYAWAYVAWLGVSAAVYMLALRLLFQSTGLPDEHCRTGILLALSFMPFLFETWIGGQISVLVFLIWSLFLYLRNKHAFLAGLALGLAIFKPTLVALPLLMLLCGRRWKILAGWASGTAAMALLSLATVGEQGCRAWLQTLVFTGRFTAGPVVVSHAVKYVDATAFLRLLLGNAGPLVAVTLLALCAPACIVLSLAWWRLPLDRGSGEDSQGAESLLWAATLSLTLVVNSYTPIYDAILTVPALALVAGALAGTQAEHQEPFRWWMLLLYMTAWVTQSFAEYLHVQVFTLGLAGFGIWVLRLAWRCGREAGRAGEPDGEAGAWPVVKLLASQGNLRLSHSKTAR